MGVRETKLPSIPEPTGDNLLDVIRAMKEVIEVGVLSVRRGDALDSNVTYRNLYELYAGGSISGSGSSNLPVPPTVRPPTDGPFPPPVDVPTELPGRPTNVNTTAVWDGIMVRWDWPTEPNTHWERAAIHASSTNAFIDGTTVGYTATNMFIHTDLGLSGPDVGDDDTSEPGVRYYWVRYEANDPVTGEVVATEWSPYQYEQGIRGQTATDITLTIENFILGSSAYPELEAISPFVIGEMTVGYTEGGDPIKELAIGFDGNFLVDGTITARAIQAHTIGAKEILAESVWAGLMTADRIISTQFTTRPRESDDFRLEINGEGTSWESFPLWYGRGETGGEGGTFWFQNYNILDGDALVRVTSMFLNGQLFVTGGGYFYGGNITYDGDGNPDPVQKDLRIEIGGPDSDFILWAGSGLTGVGTGEPDDESQPIFFIDKFGSAVFRGTVEALFVSGEISRTAIARTEGEISLPPNPAKNFGEIKDTDWVTIGEWTLPEPPFATGHIPQAQMHFLMYGKRQTAGSARLRYRMNPGDPWVGLSGSVYDLVYGGQQSLFAIVAERVHQSMQFQLQAAGFDKQAPTFANLRGLMMGIR